MNFTRIKYPDGQISCLLENFNPAECENHVTVIERINTYEDLFYVAAIKSLIDNYGFASSSLKIPCLLGQRSDRKFSNNGSFDLKIITKFINSLNFDHIEIFDPHSDVCVALLDNCISKSPENYILKSYNIIIEKEKLEKNNLFLLSPDAGVYKKIYKISEKHNIPMMASNKYRDPNGEINVTFSGNPSNKNFLICDDYLDGGKTFIQLAKNLKDNGANQVYLYVSHGLFSKGIECLQENIDKVFCTNSIKDIKDSDFIIQYNIL